MKPKPTVGTLRGNYNIIKSSASEPSAQVSGIGQGVSKAKVENQKAFENEVKNAISKAFDTPQNDKRGANKTPG